MTFSIGDLIFKDNFQFMAAGLGNLVETLISKGEDKFKEFYNMKKNFTETEMIFLYKKGI